MFWAYGIASKTGGPAMKVLGVNVGYSQSKEVTPDGRRHPLSDGSAALLDDGRLVFAGIEERHTRRRYEGGFRSEERRGGKECRL